MAKRLLFLKTFLIFVTASVCLGLDSPFNVGRIQEVQKALPFIQNNFDDIYRRLSIFESAFDIDTSSSPYTLSVASLTPGSATQILGVTSGVTAWQNQSYIDHGSVSGLTDDDHSQYALLAGRSGGQTIIGGTGSGDDLTLKSTSHGTLGSVFLGAKSVYNDTSGQLLLNTLTEGTGSSLLEIAESNSSPRFTMSTWASDAASRRGVIHALRSRSSTKGTFTATQDGDFIFGLQFFGSDSGNTQSEKAAEIAVLQNGAAGATRIPADIVFYTGTASADATERARIKSNGAITQITQPSFLVTDGTGGTNVTGDGTSYTQLWPTEVYDQGSNFASNTFTALVDGKYQFSASVLLLNILATHTGRQINIVTSNRTYRVEVDQLLAQNDQTMHINVLADMDANDTATITVLVAGSTLTVDVFGSATYNYFSGSLIN